MIQTEIQAELLTNEGVGDGDLQPHPVPDLQAGLRIGHCLDNSCHVAVDGEMVFFMNA